MNSGFDQNNVTRKRKIRKGLREQIIILILILACAVLQDFYAYRIHNVLIWIGLFTGFFRQLMVSGCAGVIGSIVGVILPVVILFPAFLRRGIGAGDIKLLSVVGSYLSYNASFTILSASIFLGGIYALIQIFTGTHKRKLHMSLPIMISTLMWLEGWI